ncbi:MAG: AmmeMemoRadiSam system protein B [Candidatus Zixiibacteriota bacterium]
MDNIRKSVLAGSWYPDNADELSKMIEGYIQNAEVDVPENRVMALISPHAGYAYSGPVAGYSFKLLKEQSEYHDFKTVIVIGFSHQGDGDGRVSVWNKGGWKTPLGTLEIDEELADKIIKTSPKIGFVPETHAREHSLEIMLPFIQVALGNNTKIVPISFSHSSMEEAQALINSLSTALDGNEDAVMIISTDMSHYHSYDKAVKMDRAAIEYITDNDINGLLDALSSREVELCGMGPVVTAMSLARRFGAEDAKLLRYANSGDVEIGDPSRVVGYCSIGFFFENQFEGFKLREESSNESTPGAEDYSLTREQKIYLLKLARQTINEYVKSGRTLKPEKPKDKKLTEKAAVFVTLERDGRLRGCIGQMMAQGPLYLAVRDMAISAAVNDHRFRPVSESELDKIDIEVSVLSPLKKIDSYEDIRLGKDGVYLVGNRDGMMRTGVFLPVVATDTGWSLDEFLGELCSQKAGLSRDCYKNPDTELYTFTVLKFSEAEMLPDDK